MKKSYFCKDLTDTLNFTPDSIQFCCAYGKSIGANITDINKISVKQIIKKRNEYIKSFDKGIIPDSCKNCILFKEKEEVSSVKKFDFINFFKRRIDNEKVRHIYVNHYKNCDCNCVYCSQDILREQYKKHYNLTSVIKYLNRQNIIDNENLTVEFQGGNVSVLDEFDSLSEEFVKNGCKNYVFYMNAIKRMKNIEELANADGVHVSVITALDAGTRETFQKIKGVDAFEQTKNNILSLIQNTNAIVSLKYIVLFGINDNIDEMREFLNFAEYAGTHYVNFEMDFNDILLPRAEKFVVPSHYYPLFEFAENYCKENGISYCINDYTKHVLQKGFADNPEK